MGVRCLLAAVVAITIVAGCGGDDPDPGVVEPADVYTAIVRWQAGEQGVVVTDDGQEQLPVIYVASAGGGTIDVGIQAAVSEAITDDATVVFADDASEAFDLGLDGSPVHDGGVMLVISPVREPAPRVRVDVDRYTAQDESELLVVQVGPKRARPSDTSAAAGDRATVIDVTDR